MPPPAVPDLSGTCLVTGAAGFIGSHLCERLLASGCRVIGVDSFTDYYDRTLKESNLRVALASPKFELRELDLVTADLSAVVEDVDFVFHLAGQAGVRASWGSNFNSYLENNVLATQRLLESATRSGRLRRLVFASSSSVYGNPAQLPATEATVPRPVSPYGVTKLAAENLCSLYALNFGLPAVALRYFTVYGPRQRPDMAFNRFTRAILEGRRIEVNGDGEQTRDFTFVADIVEVNVAAALAPEHRISGHVYNVGGGSRVSVNQVLAILAEVTGREPSLHFGPEQKGDARHTFADCSAAHADLGFDPKWSLRDGLRAEVAWISENRS